MNLLRIQDALKNASDQQLMQMMQAPDSTAPSYLVLSEIRRRKDMRAQQAPQEGSNRTVAEELTANQQPLGIETLRHGPPERDVADLPEDREEDEAGIEAMRTGGVVRMQAGGDISSMSYDQLQQLLGEVSDPRFRSSGVTATPDQIRRRIADLEAGQEGTTSGNTQIPPGIIPGLRDRGVIPGTRPRAPNPLSFLRPIEELEDQAAEAEREARPRSVLEGQERSFLDRERASDRAVRVREGAIRDIRGRIAGGTSPEESIRGALPGYPGVTEAEMRQLFGIPALASPQTPAAEPIANTPPPSATTVAPAQDPPPSTTSPATQPQGQQGQPGGGAASGGGGGAAGGGGSGGGGVPAAVASPAIQGRELPTLANLYRENQGLFADGIGALRERAQQERVDPAARRNEAVNMALIEAGLRIAGSRNPSLIGAIGEGALPAVQSYGQQLGQIRTEQREARRDELELAKQELNRQFAVGQISASELRARLSEVSADRRLSAQLAQQAGISARQERAAEDRLNRDLAARREEARLQGRLSFQEYMALPAEQREYYDRMHGRGRADVAGLAESARATATLIADLQGRLATTPAAQRPALQELIDERRAYLGRIEGLIERGRQPSGAGGTGGGASTLPSGASLSGPQNGIRNYTLPGG